MQKKEKMKSWQIITLAVLFIITVVLIIAIKVLPDQTNHAIAAEQSPDVSPSPSVALIGLNEDEPTPVPSSSPTPSPSPDNVDTTEHTNGVTVTTDNAGNQTIDRDWGSSDDSTKPSATPTPDAEASSSPSPSAESNPTPSAAASPSPSPKPSSSGGSSFGSTTPKDGATKTENGIDYTYIDGFGWVQVPDNSVGTQMDMETSGEHVGDMG